MTKQSVVLITLAVLLAGAYVAFFTDWFVKPQIQILPQIRPPQRSMRTAVGDTPVYPVTFAFDKKYLFTEIRVVATADEKTNKYPHAVWHMISDSNSIPTKALVYGTRLRGMKPYPTCEGLNGDISQIGNRITSEYGLVDRAFDRVERIYREGLR